MSRFEKYAIELMKSVTNNEESEISEKIIQKVEETISGLKEKNTKDLAKVYLHIMKKVLSKGVAYISTETSRVRNIVSEKMSEDKRSRFKKKLEVLSVFETFHNINTNTYFAFCIVFCLVHRRMNLSCNLTFRPFQEFFTYFGLDSLI